MPTSRTDYAAARHNMVLSQLEPNRVNDRAVIKAMDTVPRERFVPQALAGVAYLDEDLEIAPGRYLMEPRVCGGLMQAAKVRANDVVLDVGCGTGYSSAVLAYLGATVVALESDAGLAARASDILTDLSVENAAVVSGDLAAGLPGQGPFDVIMLGGAIPVVPDVLCRQLADGGRLLAVLGGGRIGEATLLSFSGGVLSRHALFDAALAPLPGFEPASEFSF